MKFPWKRKEKKPPYPAPKVEVSPELAELSNHRFDNQMQEIGLLKCVTCGVWVNEDELSEHEGHRIASSSGEMITQEVLERMKGGSK